MRKLLFSNKIMGGAIILLLLIAMLSSVFLPAQLTNQSPKDLFTVNTVEAAGIADYTCDGVADDAQWQLALNGLPNAGGVVGGSIRGNSGTYVFAAAVTRAIDNVTIQGEGRSTYLTRNAAATMLTAGGNNWILRDLRVDVTTATLVTAMGATTGWKWENVWTSDGYFAIRTANDVTGASIDIPTGRSATLVVAASDATATVRAQADYTCDGVADNVEIQAAINAINASGVRGLVRLVGGTFTGNAKLDAKSKVDVDGGNSIITITYNTFGYGLLFDGISNSIWENVTLRRAGAIGADTGGITKACGIKGTTPNTLILRKCNFYNDCTSTAAGDHELDGILIGPYADASPILEDCVGVGGTNDTEQNAGIDMRLLYDATTGAIGAPHLTRCTGIGPSNGILISETCNAVLRDCIGKVTGTFATFNAGIYINDSSPTLINCRGIAGDVNPSAGILLFCGGSPRLIGCEGVGGKNISSHGIKIDHSNSAILEGCVGSPPMEEHQFNYDDANNGRFRPFAGHPYSVWDVSIWVSVANAGVTVDIGTTVGGHEVAQTVSIAGTGTIPFAFNRPYVAANSYLYITPSAPIADWDIFVYYTVMYAYSNQVGLVLTTRGNARILNSSFLGSYSNDIFSQALRITGDAITYPNWRIENSHIEATIKTNYAIYADGDLYNVPIYDSTIVGILGNIKSFAGRNSGTPILTAEQKCISGSLTAGVANAIAFAWHNPELQDVLIKKVVVEITTPGGTALSVIQIGIADDAAGAGLGAEFFTAIDANAAAIRDSWLAGDTGAQTKFVFCQDFASATDGWIVGKILTQDAAALAGKYYIEYVGR